MSQIAPPIETCAAMIRSGNIWDGWFRGASQRISRYDRRGEPLWGDDQDWLVLAMDCADCATGQYDWDRVAECLEAAVDIWRQEEVAAAVKAAEHEALIQWIMTGEHTGGGPMTLRTRVSYWAMPDGSRWELETDQQGTFARRLES